MPVDNLTAVVTPELDDLDRLMPAAMPMYDPATGERVTTFREYTKAFGGPRHVAHSEIRWKRRAVTVSTVHLVLDHNWGARFGEPARPVVYETMLFGDTAHVPVGVMDEDYDLGDFQARYCLADEARSGHDEVITAVTRLLVGDGHTVVRHDNKERVLTCVADPKSVAITA